MTTTTTPKKSNTIPKKRKEKKNTHFKILFTNFFCVGPVVVCTAARPDGRSLSYCALCTSQMGIGGGGWAGWQAQATTENNDNNERQRKSNKHTPTRKNENIFLLLLFSIRWVFYFLFLKKKLQCTTRPAQTLWKSPERQEEEEGRVGGDSVCVCVQHTHTHIHIYTRPASIGPHPHYFLGWCWAQRPLDCLVVAALCCGGGGGVCCCCCCFPLFFISLAAEERLRAIQSEPSKQTKGIRPISLFVV